ncbi:hypothetical protein C474_08232 [Halogeometricum pallidum JCM 14848]|uniref:Uncharacterized protein n=1 Tax=Halogeometricum pallidum JCM 14848 TaxID=1227487 RepID=M0D845_HALPD|nr:hypothetical protein [Halogeometricum pallidum]ELZ31646.1 hypothetical protein C474_08232 [Halogeometricum pallidum JCM 14848]
MTPALSPAALSASAAHAALVAPAPLHGGAAAPASTPVPHWSVLLVAVIGLWVAIAAGVLACDRVLARLGATE